MPPKNQMDQKTVELINGMQDRINTLEYLLAQTLALSLRNTSDAESLLLDMQTIYTEKMLANGVSADSGNKGFESAVRVFTSVKVSV